MDAYGYWRSAFGGEKAPMLPTVFPAKDDGSVSWENPQPGIYKMRPSKGAAHVPVEIRLVDPAGQTVHKWRDGLILVGWINGERVDAEKLADRWTFCEAVSKSDLAHFKEHGHWPGEIAGIGHNAPPEETVVEKIKRVAADALAWLTKAGVKDDVSASMAANYRDQINAAKKELETAREAEIRPHLDAQREINGRYKPLIEEADAAGSTIRRSLADYLSAVEAEKRRVAEAARKAAEEAARKEQERIAAGAKAKGAAPPPQMTLETLLPPLPAEVPRTKVGGQYGKKTALKTVKVYTVTNYAATLAHVKDHKDVVAAVEKVAKAMARAGAPVPGVTMKEEPTV